MPFALYLLALVVFAMGTSEFMLAGLVPDISTYFSVSVGTAGLLTSAFAAGMVIGAPAMAALTRHLPVKATLLGCAIVFALSHVVGALTPDFTVLFITRVIAAIVNAGLPPDLEEIEARRYQQAAGLAEPPALFERPVIERLLRRPYRDVAFRRKVRAAYGDVCAISGLGLRNGGGRPEVQAAHIRPVEEGGNDDVRNGIALSGTLHWMFDRGLISVEPESHRILVSHNKVPGDVAKRLIVPDQRLRLPQDERDWPHPAYLAWHRENRFGQGDFLI